MKQIIQTQDAPQAVGTYSQAVKAGMQVFLSGQIPLDPKTMQLVGDDIKAQIKQVFENLSAVAKAAGGGLNDIVKLNIYLIDLTHFPLVNELMTHYFNDPYPARATLGVSALPKGASVEMDAVMVLGD
jgi:reactive intermediate/imine deaminase